MPRFTPHITVATVIEKDGRFLFVKEHAEERVVLNQPAGHLEMDESLIQAAIRETLEETGWDIEITQLIGIYLYTAPSNNVTYQRVCFAGRALAQRENYQLDEGIIAPTWLSRDELIEQQSLWRSPMVLRCIDDYLAGERFSLELLKA
ncbi:MAG: NUDIX hydrolase [Thiopseudomonas sp.]|jgi:8-oxo-dGTP pyrophosphatase MutT (NUDIX family)|nr:NUDIX hydrolase [Thiopseudomonas sp.]MBP8008530.1 NUDIX hydrolase [Thiopseudomonas sp.]HAB92605.1 NUDIX hydrolase [Pseudomonas sp.]